MENSLQLFLAAVALVVCGQLVLERIVPKFSRISSLVPIGLGLLLGSSTEALAPSAENGTLELFSALGLGLLGLFAGTRLLERQPEVAEGNAARLAGTLTTASLLGGCTLSVPHADGVAVVRQPVHPSLGFAVAWPDAPPGKDRQRNTMDGRTLGRTMYFCLFSEKRA